MVTCREREEKGGWEACSVRFEIKPRKPISIVVGGPVHGKIDIERKAVLFVRRNMTCRCNAVPKLKLPVPAFTWEKPS